MKKICFALMMALSLGTVATAQTLNVKTGGYFRSFPANETGVMNYNDGSTLTVAGHVYLLSDIEKITVTPEDGENNLVRVEYNGESADVYVSYDIIPYIDAKVNGAHVEIIQSDEVSDSTCGEITYRLYGDSNDGSFLLNGSFKCSIELTGLNLHNPSGAALDIENGKRIAVRVGENTVNTLSDGIDGSQKACIYTKGHLEFKQKGTLNVTGNKSHAISAKEYVELKNTTLNINGAVKDGINCTQYFLMESGKLTIKNTGDDGIQTDYKDADKPDEEDTGTITIEGGSLEIEVTAAATKALSAEGRFVMTDGTLIANAKGDGLWDESKLKTKSSSCINADEGIFIEGGNINLTATGGGGKGMNTGGEFSISDGEIIINTTGGLLAYVNGSLNQNYTGNTDRLDSDYKSAPKGVKADGDVLIQGGAVTVMCTGNGAEGIESKSEMTINGGDLKIRAYDDGVNSSSDMYIKGGNLDIMSIGNGDGVDANGNIYISGGKMQIFARANPEQGFDAGDGYSIYFTGGEILAYGPGGNSVPSTGTQSTQPYLSLSQTPTAGQKVTVSKDGTELVSFTVPEDFSLSNSGGGFPFMAPGAPGGGSRGGALVISCPGLVSGSSYDVNVGSQTLTATAQ